jgi:hypothetical protein
MPGIHVLAIKKDVDARDKRGQDDYRFGASENALN